MDGMERHTYKVGMYKDEYHLMCLQCGASFPLEGETVEERTIDMFNAMLSLKWEGCDYSTQNNVFVGQSGGINVKVSDAVSNLSEAMSKLRSKKNLNTL